MITSEICSIGDRRADMIFVSPIGLLQKPHMDGNIISGAAPAYSSTTIGCVHLPSG